MNVIVPLGLLLCSALWLKGLKSIWARALLLAGFLGLTFLLIPSISRDTSQAHLAIYQEEARAFAAKMAADIDRGESEAARKRLLYFANNQDWSVANDLEALRSFYKQAHSANEVPPSNLRGLQASTPK